MMKDMTIKTQKQTATEGTDNLQLLTDRELDRVAGGDFHFTRVVDKVSPYLFLGTASGKHLRIG
jgi:type VI protein secretion system component Hcp